MYGLYVLQMSMPLSTYTYSMQDVTSVSEPLELLPLRKEPLACHFFQFKKKISKYSQFILHSNLQNITFEGNNWILYFIDE